MNAVPSEAPSGKKNAVNLIHRIFLANAGARILLCQFHLLVRHQFLTDIIQQHQITFVVFQNVGNQLVLVHILHIVPDAPVEK
ncbi:Uncharacterised protein [Neisseria gonorrhoeae]|uniref:Uncharacterized protein n=1 Tax=Neisseria gonorrhoeae TaxID=485 RepID=A0A378VXY1_NEIGO|nr:Uncharacterised protein [Neisseria gonorrhoeae]